MIEELLKPLTSLPKIGENLAKYLTKLIGGNKVFDLLLHKPTRIEKIKILPKFSEISHEELVVIRGRIEAHQKPANNRQPFKIICYCPDGYFTLTFFKIFPSQLAKLTINNEIAVLGFFEKAFGENQITHPIAFLPALEIHKFPRFYATYPLCAGITNRIISHKIQQVLSRCKSDLPEWIDGHLLQKQKWPDFYQSLNKIHLPETEEDLINQGQFSRRLAFDELLAWQIAMIIAKNNKVAFTIKDNNLVKFKNVSADKLLADNFLKILPFALTKAQIAAINQIALEISSPKKMLRLLQGDVGSGKTAIAIHACLKSIEFGRQTVVIAPTTVLAKQHFIYFSQFLANSKVRLAILTSATTAKLRKSILAELAAGKIDILISTHAVLEPDVIFKNLGFAVIDEQHRFGVLQRIRLIEKGQQVDVLLMSATPIPRSLMMGLYGDIDISILNEKPKNRLPITTSILSQKKSAELFESLKKVIVREEKVFWICPAIDENPDLGLISVFEKFAELQAIFGAEKIVLLHGKMKESEKEKVMRDFADEASESKIMVATTVIEVGIDIPSATVIVIDNAENFGLAQLHQLRGRVGRSGKQSFCVLLYGEKFGANAKQRLGILKASNDGFFIAEEDLKLRGSGEFVGTKQSGFPEFRIANLATDSDLVLIANKQAKIVLNSDENLTKPASQKYRYLLRLFGYEDCLRMMAGG